MENETKKNRKGYIVAAIVAAIAVVAAGIGYAVYAMNKAAEQEAGAYAILEGNYDLADFEQYLEDYPDGEHAPLVRERLEKLKEMAAQWEAIDLKGRQADFANFKRRYQDAHYDQLCDMKIDSLDWSDAQRLNTSEAYAIYLRVHPDGRYVSEAIVVASTIATNEVADEEREALEGALQGFFKAFGDNDEEAVCTFIPPVMAQFLSKPNATKADVVGSIGKMFNEHIKGCTFTLNNDFRITKQPAADGTIVYKVDFSVDQRIERDNEGKTFGSYTATAELNSLYKITALTMKEVSKQ